MSLSSNQKRKVTRTTNEKLDEVVKEPTAPVPVTVLGAILELLFTDEEEYEYALNTYEKFLAAARSGQGEFKSKGQGSAECISFANPAARSRDAAPAEVGNKQVVLEAMTAVMSHTRCDTMAIIVRHTQQKLSGKVSANSVARWVFFLLKPTKPPFKDCGNGTYSLL